MNLKAKRLARERLRRLAIYRANEQIGRIRNAVLIYELPPRVKSNMKDHTLENAEAHLNYFIEQASTAVKYLKEARGVSTTTRRQHG